MTALNKFVKVKRDMEKNAKLDMDALKQVAVGAGIATAIPLLTVAGFELADAVRSALTKKRNFKRMIEVHKDIADHDKVTVQRSFDTLQRLNPTFAADPMISGAFVKHITGADVGITPEVATQLINARKSLQAIKSFQPDTGSGSAVVGAYGDKVKNKELIKQLAAEKKKNIMNPDYRATYP